MQMQSGIHLYIVYRVIQTSDDVQALQRDLNILFQWSIDWQMVFNLDKCEHLQVSLKIITVYLKRLSNQTCFIYQILWSDN